MTDASAAFLPFQQSAAYVEAARACGARTEMVDVGPGTALAIERAGVRMIFRGPVWTGVVAADERRRAIRRLARRFGPTIVTPEEPAAGFGLVPLVTPFHHAIWDLAGDLRPGLDPRWRNHLAGAERRGLAIARAGLATLDDLLRADLLQRQARGYRTMGVAFSRALPPGAVQLWEWRQDGVLGAAMCFVRHGTTATYHLAWASPAARSLAVHQVMLWQAALALRAEGVRWLDLGSVDTEAAPGLARFKLGTGARLRRLGATCLVLP
jgi:Acetyltransferase (GNAT) domain